VIDVSGLSPALLASDVLYPVLGLVVGSETGEEIPVIAGLPPNTHEDRLKAIGAAAASSGSGALFHAVGSTPEAPTLEAALQGQPPDADGSISFDELRSARVELMTAADGDPLRGVSLGTPHASLEELRRVRNLLG